MGWKKTRLAAGLTRRHDFRRVSLGLNQLQQESLGDSVLSIVELLYASLNLISETSDERHNGRGNQRA
jgi:hypothetical protein